MTLKTSLIITGDSTVAKAAVDELAGEVRKLGSTASATAAQTGQLDRAQSGNANSARGAGAASASLSAELGKQRAAVASLESDYSGAKAQIGALEAELRGLQAQLKGTNTRMREQTGVANDNVRSAGQVKVGYFQLGQQMQDVGIQLSMGTDLMRVMAMQGGQLATAIDMIGPKGAAGTFVRFLAGPWGAVLMTATAVLGPMIAKLIEGSDAADTMTDRLNDAATAADSFGTAQSMLGKAIDLTTGKLKTQNQVLLQAIKLQAQQKLFEAQEKIDDAKGPTQISGGRARVGSFGLGAVGGGNIDAAVAASRAAKQQETELARIRQRLLATVANDTLARGNPGDYSRDVGASLNAAIGQLDKLAQNGKIAGKSLTEVKLDLIELANTGTDKAAALEALSVIGGGPVPDELQPYARDNSRTRKPKKAPSTDARDEFGRDAAARIASIRESFDDTPQVVRQVNSAIAQLDDLMDDLARKKPPGFEDLIAGAREAKTVVEKALTRPFDDFVRSEREAASVQELLIAGRQQEAEALQIELRLQQQMGPLTEQQRATIADIVRQRYEEGRALDRTYRVQQLYLDAARDTAGVIEDATQAFVRGDLGQFLKTPEKLVDVFQSLNARAMFEDLFGEAFADLSDEIRGVAPLERAAGRMADVIDTAAASIAKLGSVAEATATGQPTESEIVVTGTPVTAGTMSPTGVMERALGSVATEIAGLFSSRSFAEKLGGNIGKAGATALKGAATGQMISGIGNSLGLKMSGTGAQIGGALGSLVPVPGGDIIGSILGGLVGSVFGGKTKSGYASITTDAAGNAASAITREHNSSSRGSEALGYAGAVLDGLSQIAQQLGGTLGASLNLGTIGTQNDKYVFDADGAGPTAGVKTDSLEEAVSAALSSAISKGAVSGLSSAVRQALGSSDDLNSALSEALKVQQLEELLDGVGGKLEATFRQFDAEAAERVRLAKSYGLDLLAVEKKNAEERAQLLDDTLKSRVGSLQSLLSDLNYGDLFEGDASQRRAQILKEIEDARADADAGHDGAADRLAELYRLLTETSREAFGTAGSQYATDRQTARDGAAAVIKEETDRLNAAARAQEQQTSALQDVARQSNETNDLLAVANTRLAGIAALLDSNGLPIRGPDLALTSR